ncbi:hypothetical protein Xind_01325 [Xenorhabdus indica]|nr:hypothetical protein [Xenorhabdus indica]
MLIIHVTGFMKCENVTVVMIFTLRGKLPITTIFARLAWLNEKNRHKQRLLKNGGVYDGLRKIQLNQTLMNCLLSNTLETSLLSIFNRRIERVSPSGSL